MHPPANPSPPSSAPPDPAPTWGELLLAVPAAQQALMRWWLADLRDCSLTMIPVQERPSPPETDAFHAALKRRLAGEPIQYICGRAPFLDMMLTVTPAVLIPRPETEQLLERVRREVPPPRRILDVGTGSGCIALALKRFWPEAEVTAVDLCENALAVARTNAERLGLTIRFLHSDLLQALQGERFDLMVANLPYVGERERKALPAEVRDFEPALALFSGEDGTDLVLELMRQAKGALAPGGNLYLETGETQSDSYRGAARSLGWELDSFADLAGRERFHRLRPPEDAGGNNKT